MVLPCEVFDHPYIYLGWGLSPALFEEEDDFEAFEESMHGLVHELEHLGEHDEVNEAWEFVRSDWQFVDEAEQPIQVGGWTTAPRLREGIERFFITDINNPGAGGTGQSTLPVCWDAIGQVEDGAAHFNHIPSGCNVLYLDGHVEFVRYQRGDGEFPVDRGGLIVHHASHMGAHEHEHE
jgi:prepilin-type processing-associated H-X9-DG protein